MRRRLARPVTTGGDDLTSNGNKKRKASSFTGTPEEKDAERR